MEAVDKFYDTALYGGPDIMLKLPSSITDTLPPPGLKEVKDAWREYLDKEKELQNAIEAKDKAFADMDKWMREFAVRARRALSREALDAIFQGYDVGIRYYDPKSPS